ncbi:hypothetical protein AB0C29_07985 [Actinoplanes sp. NPDC048791]|uniref:hypothetical protein n=1 Tax=Actinoplanes sp. NPDC048791 TaxID=3154623 RepID=UPI00340154C0
MAGVALVLAGAPASAAVAAADTTAPALTSITLSRESIDVKGDEVQLLTVNVGLTDDVGVASFDDQAMGTGPTPSLLFGSQLVPVGLVPGTGTPRNGVWTGVVAVTSDWAATERPVKVFAQDDAGNRLVVDPSTVIDVPAVTVRSSHTPVVALTFSPDPVLPNAALTATVRVTDKGTGEPMRNLPVVLGEDNTCVEDVISRPDGYTDSDGRYRRVYPAGQIYDFITCAWVAGPNVPGQWSTRIGFTNGVARYKFVVSATPASASVPAGTNVNVNGQVVPAVPGQNVQLQRLYGTEWRTVGTGTTRSTSRFTLVATPPGVATYSYRVYVPGDDRHAGSTSATFTIRGT